MDKLKGYFSSTSNSYLLQGSDAECGLACIGSILNTHGCNVGMQYLRSRFPMFQQGATLSDLIKSCGDLGLSTVPFKLETDELKNVTLPCVIHWDMNHFVVLSSINHGTFTIHDPSKGKRTVNEKEFELHFTGVALEAQTNESFQKIISPDNASIKDIVDFTPHIKQTLFKVFLLSIILLVIALAMPLFLQVIIDDVLPQSDAKLLFQLVITFTILVLLQTYTTSLRARLTLYLSTHIGTQLTTSTFSHLLKLPLTYFLQRFPANLQTRFDSIEQIRYLLSNKLVESALDGMMALGIFIVLFYYHTPLAGIVLISTLLYTWLKFRSYPQTKKLTDNVIDSSALNSAYFLESVQTINSIKLSELEKPRLYNWQSKITQHFNQRLHLNWLKITVQQQNNLIWGLDNILVIALGATMVISQSGQAGAFSLGMLTAFMAYKVQLNFRLTNLIENAFELKLLSLHAERIADITNESPEEHTDVSLDDCYSIELKNVCFQYPGSNNNVLDNINLSIQQGEHIALIGSSGTGKSTFFNMLLGIHPYSSGTIRINQQDFSPDMLHAFRRLVGVMSQQDVLLSGSILDNVSGFIDSPDIHQVKHVCQMCCIDNKIESLPMGYQTLVGELGSTLSGGELQRIMIARALYNKPRWLILDEATSHLDTATEQKIYSNLSDLGLTIISITHRSSVTAYSTQVAKLESNGSLTVCSTQAIPT